MTDEATDRKESGKILFKHPDEATHTPNNRDGIMKAGKSRTRGNKFQNPSLAENIDYFRKLNDTINAEI